MTNEEKLKAIISAQVKGGYKKYEYVPECLISHEPRPDKDDGMYYIDKGFIHEFEWLEAAMMPKPILLILLDTEGCKAAYGEELKYTMWKTMDCEQLRLPKWNECSSKIHKAWHLGEGNNWEEAINTAYSLLPKK